MKSDYKTKLNELFILTTFFCIMVVLVHLTSEPVTGLLKGSYQHMLFFIVNKSMSFVVPGFVFLSGLKLCYSYKNKKFYFFEFIYKKLGKIFIPYLFWYLVYYFKLLSFGFIEAKTISQHIFSFLIGDLISTFYFITIIFQFYILFGIILYLFKNFNNKFILIFTFVFSFIYFKYVYFNYDDRFFGSYLIYFILGCYVAFNIEYFRVNLKKYIVFIFIAFIIILIHYLKSTYMLAVYSTVFANWRIWGFLFGLTAILVFYYISYILEAKFGANTMIVFKAIDGASYYIFLSHCIMLYICSEIWFNMNINSIIGKFIFTSCILFPTIFIGCILYNYIKNCIKNKN